MVNLKAKKNLKLRIDQLQADDGDYMNRFSREKHYSLINCIILSSNTPL